MSETPKSLGEINRENYCSAKADEDTRGDWEIAAQAVAAHIRAETDPLVKAALALDSVMTEFDGDHTCCQEHFDAFWNSCTAYRALNKEEQAK